MSQGTLALPRKAVHAGTSSRVNPVWMAIVALAIALFATLGGVPAHAEGDSQAMQNLSTEVHTVISSNEYEMDGGGTLRGSQLLTKQGDGLYGLDDAAYEKLNSKGRDNLASDIISATNSAVENGDKTGVTEETASNWMKQLQQHPGFGSKILQETLKNTGPDFVTANNIYQPFSGLVSTLLGLGAILIFALLGLVMVCDIAYITIPPFRLVMGGEGEGGGGGGYGGGHGGGGGGAKSKLVSAEARNAVEASENSGGDGKQKSALGAYFKTRIISLIILGLCLVYLIQGQIYVLIGWILDLFNGFLGF